jgi:hypothetical protein
MQTLFIVELVVVKQHLVQQMVFGDVKIAAGRWNLENCFV